MRLFHHSFLRVCSVLVLFSLLNIVYAQPASAEGVAVEASVQYTFGGQIDFTAHVQADLPVKKALILFNPQGEAETLVKPVFVTPPGDIKYQHDLTTRPITAFSRIEYWFKITLEDDVEYTSERFSFYYEDNRYQWQVLEDRPVRLHWYEGDQAFAQGVMDVAQEGLEQIRALVPLPLPDWTNIYVYASSAEMQSTLRLSGMVWIAGHADPELGVIVVALPNGPELRLITSQRIPHELMHILLYQAIGKAYTNLPTWFSEGLASMAELDPNPDYDISLAQAVEEQNLIAIRDLCQQFPVDAAGNALAYAEAARFTYFLYRKFGSSGLETLVAHYANGLGCEQAVQTAYNLSLTELETEWLKTSYTPEQQTPDHDLPPVWSWFAVLMLILCVSVIVGLVYLRKNRSVSEAGG